VSDNVKGRWQYLEMISNASMQSLVHRLQLDLEPRVGPYPFAKNGKQEWDGQHGKGYETQQAGTR